MPLHKEAEHGACYPWQHHCIHMSYLPNCRQMRLFIIFLNKKCHSSTLFITDDRSLHRAWELLTENYTFKSKSQKNMAFQLWITVIFPYGGPTLNLLLSLFDKLSLLRIIWFTMQSFVNILKKESPWFHEYIELQPLPYIFLIGGQLTSL